jgi:hypothetical protein
MQQRFKKINEVYVEKKKLAQSDVSKFHRNETNKAS